MSNRNTTTFIFMAVAAATLAACSNTPMSSGPGASTMAVPRMVDNMSLPEPVRVPAGQTVKMSTTGVGELTYECRDKKDMAGQYEWTLLGPVATLYGPGQKAVGKYYAGPTWESMDGSKVTGKQVAVAPGGPGNIPLQLVQADTPMGMGAMQGVSYIQRLNTKGGVAPSAMCDMSTRGTQQKVAYQADYVFYGR